MEHLGCARQGPASARCPGVSHRNAVNAAGRGAGSPVWMYFKPRSIWYKKNWWCSGVRSSFALMTYADGSRTLSQHLFYELRSCGAGPLCGTSTWCRSVSMSSNTT